MTNSTRVGIELEERAKKILKSNGFTISKDRVRRMMPYDIIAYKDSEKFLIEVKGRKEGKQQRNFCVNQIKIEKLIEQSDKNILFIFLNKEGYIICSLDDIINNIPLRINNKKIFIGFNRSFRRRENIRAQESKER